MKWTVGYDGLSGPIITGPDGMYIMQKYGRAGWDTNFAGDDALHVAIVEALNAYKPLAVCTREVKCSHGAEWRCICDCHGPLPKMLYDTMQELEKLPGSEQQTKVVVMLSRVGDKVRELLYENALNVSQTESQSDLV